MGPTISDWKKGERFEIFGEVFEVVRVDKGRKELQAQSVSRDEIRDRDVLGRAQTFHIRDLSLAKPFDEYRWQQRYGK